MYCHFDKILSESKHFENNNKIKRWEKHFRNFEDNDAFLKVDKRKKFDKNGSLEIQKWKILVKKCCNKITNSSTFCSKIDYFQVKKTK
jgi:hypothetical protein